MTVTVYVEGKSDCLALEALLSGLLAQKRQQGVGIKFFPTPPEGDRKKILLTKMPTRALSILKNQPHSTVILLPDLYPPNKGFPHRTHLELCQGVMANFHDQVARKGLADMPGLTDRFKIFCLKHDLEVLLLAARERLTQHLSCREFNPDWNPDVEEQNQDNPPSKVVERWFRACGKGYVKTADAPAILAGADYHEIAARCPQCFKPFVEFLEACGPAGA